MNVKEKSSWKSIPISANSFEHKDLICFEELTDYEVVSFDSGKTDSQEPLSRKEQKRQKRLLEFQAKKRLLEQPETEKDINDAKRLKKDMNNNKSSSCTKTLKKKTKNKAEPAKKDQLQQQVEAHEELKIDMSAWHTLLVPEEILRALREMSFKNPTQIQQQVITTAIQAKLDIVAAAETGSGKTLAFGIPLLHHLMEDRARGFDEVKPGNDDESEMAEDEVDEVVWNEKNSAKILPALILTPTRELAIQVKDHLVKAGKHTGFKMVAIVGGMSVQKQERQLASKPDILIATPGRLWEFIQQGHKYLSNLHQIRYLIIDEADRMLEQGHFEELSKILDVVNDKKHKNIKRQTYMFSATLTTVHYAPNRVKTGGKANSKTVKLETLMNKIGIKEKRHVVDLTTKKGTAERLYEAKIICNSTEKDLYMYYFIKSHPGRTLVFTNSIDCIFHLTGVLQALSLTPLHLHAKMQQRQRLKHLERFHANADSILIASDVAARGLDIPDVQYVIHYQVPRTCETYIHRSGRSARTGKEGLSLLLVSPEELSIYKRLCRSLKLEDGIPQFPVDERSLTATKKIVKIAKEIDALGHKRKKVRLNNDWFSKAAEEMDIELDDDMIIVDDQAEEVERSIQEKQKQLKSLLKQPIFPKQFSGKYLTKMGKLVLPGTNQTSAIEKVKNVTKKGLFSD